MKVLLLCFFIVMLAVSYQDMKCMEIKDGCHIAITALAATAVFAGLDAEILSRLAGALCISAPMLAITLLIPGSFGGGDIKLMAAAGLFLGWKSTIVSAVIALFAAGAYVLFLIVKKKAGRGRRFALAPFLCAGMVIGALWGEDLWRLWQGW